VDDRAQGSPIQGRQDRDKLVLVPEGVVVAPKLHEVINISHHPVQSAFVTSLTQDVNLFDCGQGRCRGRCAVDTGQTPCKNPVNPQRQRHVLQSAPTDTVDDTNRSSSHPSYYLHTSHLVASSTSPLPGTSNPRASRKTHSATYKIRSSAPLASPSHQHLSCAVAMLRKHPSSSSGTQFSLRPPMLSA
jgi:hypothetical protein